MRHHWLPATILCVIYLLVCLPTDRAQDAKPSPPAKRRYDHHGVIKSVYEPSRDVTTVALQPYRILEEVDVFHTRQRIVRIMAAYNFSGRTPAQKPDVVAFAIIADTVSETRFNNGKLELTAVADGEQISLGKLRPRRPADGPRVETPYLDLNVCSGCRIFREELIAQVRYEGLLKIANSKKVEMKVGSVKLKLDKDLLTALRDLASRAVP